MLTCVSHATQSDKSASVIKEVITLYVKIGYRCKCGRTLSYFAGCFETGLLTSEGNLAALADLSGALDDLLRRLALPTEVARDRAAASR